jgi:hypothetical protein
MWILGTHKIPENSRLIKNKQSQTLWNRLKNQLRRVFIFHRVLRRLRVVRETRELYYVLLVLKIIDLRFS